MEKYILQENTKFLKNFTLALKAKESIVAEYLVVIIVIELMNLQIKIKVSKKCTLDLKHHKIYQNIHISYKQVKKKSILASLTLMSFHFSALTHYTHSG